MSWVEEAEKVMAEHRGNVAEVVKVTSRDEAGITYEVRLRLADVPGAQEQADWEIGPVWERRVDFSRQAGAGGPAFTAAAREQDFAALAAWNRTQGIQ